MLASTPLIGADLVAVDTETTGLDPARARIVEVAAVTVRRGALVEAEGFERLVDPGEPVPAAARVVHGLGGAELAGAPPFSLVLPGLAAFIGSRWIIGHAIGFDLAVLARECARAGLPWAQPPSLCTRRLARLCLAPGADIELDALAGRFGLPVTGRHRAMPDARLAADVFLALLPGLRERGIRTLAEAAQATRAAAEEEAARTGWSAGAVPAGLDALSRIDAYPFRHRVRDVMSSPPEALPDGASLAEAIRRMTERRISSVMVGDAAALAGGRAGILTERDVLRALDEEGSAALAAPIGPRAGRPLASVAADEFVYRAIGRMDRRRIRHLAVVDEAGAVIGALSARDLLKLRASGAHALGEAIAVAEDAPALAAAWAETPRAAAGLVAEGVPAREVAAVISAETAAATKRAAELAEAELAARGHGPPPARYAVLVLGSAGRGESLLAPDQDNAVIWADGAEPGADAWFARFGALLADTLDAAGIPYCKGGVMAREPGFRGSLATWRARVAAWLAADRADDVLAVDIFFDLRSVAGTHELADELLGEARAAAARDPALAKLLAAELDGWRPPLGWLGGFATENGRVDLKRGGLFPIVAAARCLALRHGLPGRSTAERLAALRAAGLGAEEDLAAMDFAHERVLDALLRQQLADIAAGRPPTNRVDPAALGKRDARRLKAALAGLADVPDTVRDLLFR
jgi:DNA polymerase-3 subunit epsilon/CBS domain-containing protein